MRELLFRGILAVIGIAIAVSLYQILVVRDTYVHVDQVNDAASIYAPRESQSEPAPDKINADTDLTGAWTVVEKNKDAAGNNPIIDAQQNINGDIAAWLKIPGASIDYPVVYGEDNTFYLTHDIYKQKAVSGALFIDSRNHYGFIDFNTVIYGHNMKDGSMFGQLSSFTNPAFFQTNPKGQLFSAEHIYTLEIFACLRIKQDDKLIFGSFNGVNFDEYNEFVRANAINYRDIQLNGGDRNVALSTCTSGGYSEYRVVVLARLMPMG